MVLNNGKVIEHPLQPIGCSIGELVLNKPCIFAFTSI